MIRLIAIVLFLLPVLTSNGQKQLDSFSLKDVRNDEVISLSSYSSSKALVIIFTSNYCPFAKLYDERIRALYDEFSPSGVAFVLVNPNNVGASPDDSEAKMKEAADKNALPFPYLSDKQQQLAVQLDARKTPESFLLTPSGTSFVVKYEGAIDDNPQSAENVKQEYLWAAIKAVLDGKPVPSSVRPTGCMIRGN